MGASSPDDDDSIPGPGPFPLCVLDMTISTDSSSYCPSRRRDLPCLQDSIDTSSHSTISLNAYRQHRTEEALDTVFSTDDSSYCPSRRRDLPYLQDTEDTSSHSTISLKAYRQHRREEAYFSTDQSLLPRDRTHPTTGSSDTRDGRQHSAKSNLLTSNDQTMIRILSHSANQAPFYSAGDRSSTTTKTTSDISSEENSYVPLRRSSNGSSPTVTTTTYETSSQEFHNVPFRRACDSSSNTIGIDDPETSLHEHSSNDSMTSMSTLELFTSSAPAKNVLLCLMTLIFSFLF